MQDAIFAFMQQFGYLAVSALIFLENVFPPIPSELILPLAGFFSNAGALWLPLAILAATAGSLAGAYVLYAVGTGLDERRMEKILSSRPARLLGFEKGDVQAAFGWFETKGAKTVFICRCVPVVRSLISIPAGMSHMGILKFSAMTFAGSLIWNAILCALGYLAGDAWQNAASGAASVIDHVTYIVLAAIAVAALAWFVKRVIPKIKSQGIGGTGPIAE
ncbi:MAG: DedA family protein [Olsenella sp.]|jgi:membrane protein DedA with SNARE-associated domain